MIFNMFLNIISFPKSKSIFKAEAPIYIFIYWLEIFVKISRIV